MNVLWQKLLLTTIFWLAIEICFNLIGIDEIYRFGGVQAVAAFAIGTQTVKVKNAARTTGW